MSRRKVDYLVKVKRAAQLLFTSKTFEAWC